MPCPSVVNSFQYCAHTGLKARDSSYQVVSCHSSMYMIVLDLVYFVFVSVFEVGGGMWGLNCRFLFFLGHI